PGTVANGIERSAEAYTRCVKSWYQMYLGRSAANGEEQGWVRLLLNGFTEEKVLLGIIGSAEYYAHASALNHSGNSDQDLIQTLFQQFLGRSAGSGEVAAFASSVLPSLGHGGAAWVVLSSAEFRGDMVRSYYSTLLHRSGSTSPVEINAWVFS